MMLIGVFRDYANAPKTPKLGSVQNNLITV